MRRILSLAGIVLVMVMTASAALAEAGKVALVIEVESIGKLTSDIDVLSNTLDLPASGSAIETALETSLHTSGLRGLDTNKTVQVYVFLPAVKQGAPTMPLPAVSVVWVVPTTDDGSTYLKSVRAVFETSMKAKGVNHFFGGQTPDSYPLPDFFLGMARGMAIAGAHQDNVEFLTGLLQKGKIEVAGMENVRGTVRAAANIKTCLPSIETAISQAGLLTGPTPLRPNPNLAQNPMQKLQSQAEAVLGILRQVNSFSLGIGVDSGNIELSTSMIPKSNSNLDTIIKSMGAPSEQYMTFLAENAYLASAGSGLNIMDEFIDPYCDMLESLYEEMGPEMSGAGKSAVASMRAMKGLYSGDFVIGVVPGPGGDGVSLVEVLAVNDAAKARKQADETLASYNEMYGAMTPGMTVTVNEPRTYKGVEILSVEYSMGEQTKGVPGMPSLFTGFKAEIAFTDKEVIYTTGKPEVMNAAIDQLKKAGGIRIDNTKAFKSVFSKVRGIPVKVTNLRLLGLLKAAMNAMPDINAQQLAAIPDDVSAISGYSYKAGSEVIGVVRVSLREIAVVRESVPMAMGVMAQSMMMSAMQQNNAGQPRPTEALCKRNLRLIDAAKEQCALERNLRDGTAIQKEWLTKYLFGGKVPVCPEDGTYTTGTVGQSPKCSIPGHSLQ